MLSGFYTAASGMVSRFIALNHITNNVSSANVTGYKKEEVLFRSFDADLALEASKQGPFCQADLASGIDLIQRYTDFSQGPLKYTGENGDVAIDGEGFFTVNTGHGVFFTRQGRFMVNGDGELTTTEGHQVLNSEGSPIRLEGSYNAGEQFIIDELGNVSVMRDNAKIRFGKINLVKFANPQNLERLGHCLWKNPENDSAGILSSEAKIQQKYRELSNISPVEGMVDLMYNQRLYDAQANALKAVHESLGNFIKTIGS